MECAVKTGKQTKTYSCMLSSFTRDDTPTTASDKKSRLFSQIAELAVPGSTEFENLLANLRKFYPEIKEEDFASRITNQLGENLFHENSIELIASQLDGFEDPAVEQFRFGRESVWYGIMAESSTTSSSWAITELGHWGTRRRFTREPPRETVVKQPNVASK